MGVGAVRGGAVGDHLRVGSWRGDESVAYLALHVGGVAPTVDAVRRTCAEAAGRGYAEAVTAALGPGEARGFLLAGFEVRERLHLLAHDLRALPPPAPAALRRGRRRDRPAVLAVDARAFAPFWRLDEPALDEALGATPSSRFRVVPAVTGPGRGDPDDVAGYAVTGRAGRRGFLQRLAVDPDHQGGGLGRALAIDGLAWCRRRGVERVVVNTQEANERARQLYLDLGFRQLPGGLAVLRSALAGP
jgi:ribosomal protein S18 acetylase RimI-like enzyme